MASFFSRLYSIVTHPATTITAMVSGIGSIAALAISLQTAVDQAAAMHGLPDAVHRSFSDFQMTLATVAAISSIIVSFGHSLLTVLPPTPDSRPPMAAVLPFQSSSGAASTSAPDQQKAA